MRVKQIHKVCIILPPKPDWNFVHKPRIRVYFSTTICPRHSRPSDPALRLRNCPRGCPPQAKIFSKKNQNERFSLRNLLFSLFLPLYFGWNFGYFMKNIKFYQNLKNFRKFLKIFENFLIKKFFEKKFFFEEKNWKKCKKKNP